MNLYKNIEQAIRQHKEKLHINSNVQEIEVQNVIRWVMRDNPDIFWFAHQYHFCQREGVLFFKYQFSKERSELIKKSIDDVVENDFQIEYVQLLDAYE